MPYATVQDVLDRVAVQVLTDLTTEGASGPPDQARIATALTDATGELDGWLGTIPVERHPGADTLRGQCIKVTLYLLTLGRPGKEFEQVRNAYNDVRAFYDAARAEATGGAGATPIRVAGEAPAPEFDRPGAWKGFAP